MTSAELSDRSRRARLGARHRLTPSTRSDDVTEIAKSVVALHSTDPVSVYLGVLARMLHPSLSAVRAALYEHRSLVRHHAMRRTLWVGTPETVGVMHHACTVKIASLERRRTEQFLAQNGVERPGVWLDDAKERVSGLVGERGPLTARQIGQALPDLARPLAMAPGKPYAATQGAHSRVVAGLGFDGVLVRTRPLGGWTGGQYAWMRVEHWSPSLHAAITDPSADMEAAQRDLAWRWLARFGPGTTRDLSWYAGWTLAETRRALTSLEAVPVRTPEGSAWLLPGDDAGQSPDVDTKAEQEPWVALLPSLDPTVMGWKGRAFYLTPGSEAAWDRNGNAGPTIWVDGAVVGAWAQRADGEIRLHYFRPVPARRRAQVARRAEQVSQWLADTRIAWRFPGAINAELVR
ncbi:MAG: winged helix DNA-binding domain-containing protein [Ornithinimicrobium sp.]